MRLHTSLLALAAIAALAGCYVPSAPDEVLYGAVTATNYDAAANFASYGNVVVNQDISVVDDTTSGVTISPAVVTGVIGEIEQNLRDRGYTPIKPGDPGEAGALKVGAYAIFNSVAMFYSSYWCSWYYYYYCYPTTSYAGSYNYGTLIIEAGSQLYDPADPPQAPPPGTNPPRAQLVWTSASYGVMAGGSNITTSSPGYQKVLGSIDQAFAQSPYFTK
jgi:hypothetical protein